MWRFRLVDIREGGLIFTDTYLSLGMTLGMFVWERHDVWGKRLGDLRIGWVIAEMLAKVKPILASMQVIHCRKSRRKPGQTFCDSCRSVGCRCGDVRPCDR